MNKYAEALQRAAAGRTAYEVVKAWAESTGRPVTSVRTILYRAWRGERILRLDQAAEICAALDLEPGALQPDLRQSSPSARSSDP